VDVFISEGDVFEKGSIIYCDVNVDVPSTVGEGSKGGKANAKVFEIHTFPSNPKVPKTYMELRSHTTDATYFAGGTDIFPALPDEEALKDFQEGLENVCSRHNKSYEELRQVRMGFFKSNYRKTEKFSTVGIYSFKWPPEDLDYVKAMAETYFERYTKIVEKRKAEKFAQEDKDAQLLQFGRMAEWILLEDQGTKFGLDMGMPAEALLGAILPGTAKFKW
jgi:coproporphyrinogen III oxidase